MKGTVILLIISMFIAGCSKQKDSVYPFYDIDLEFNPGKQYVAVDCQLDIPAQHRSDTLVFYLHRQLQVSNLEMEGKQEYILNTDSSDIRYMPFATKYEIITDNPSHQNITVHMEYSGEITEWYGWSPSVISKEWTELGLYYPWYPLNPDFGLFNYEVGIIPVRHQDIFLMGSSLKKNDRIIYSTDFPTNDIVVCASEDLKIFSDTMSGCKLDIVHNTFPDTLLHALRDEINDISGLYNKWFPEGGNRVCLVESMREQGGGYARLGGIYLSGLNSNDFFGSRKKYTRYLAHEISHLWWYRADANTWHDWINEGFAEYSALMVLRDFYGQEYFEKWISMKQEAVKGKDPVWHYDRSGRYAHTIFYDKAPLILHDLETKIGKDDFRNFMYSLLEQEAGTTSRVLDVLEKEEGKDISEWFLDKLKNI